MAERNNVEIGADEKITIDGIVELKQIESYEVKHIAGDAAEFTVTMKVTVNQSASGR